MRKMFKIAGKVGLITGGATGIGAAIARNLLEAGLKGIAIVDINERDGLESVSKLNEEFGKSSSVFIRADVSVREQLDDAFKKTVKTFNNLDIVVNNAGRLEDSEWEATIGINLVGTVNGTILAYEHYLPTYKSDDETVIVNISSMAALHRYPLAPIYASAKAGIIALTRSLGCGPHYKRTKIKTLAICPGITSTAILDVKEDHFLGPAYFRMYQDLLRSSPPQPISAVSNAVIKVIKEGRSGSLWAVEHSREPVELNFQFEPKI
ncbi:hypothetical protein PPYR_10154 [Photinus pyralis]|uniref:Alcohol dehydrogenase n=2 Tax=Photinus pyralis TaxID=7054 RepID=A0A1Y1MY41_PHOPY|nr:15-hydroxyprostaglandin dehydrogenase [NAD(+)]-like isoform X2 [Photinus pyralis]KAB0796093.1 hypothetical protein PPYR_10154 [Photinus pyralis]